MVGGGMIVLPSVLVNSGNFFPSRRLEPGEFKTDPWIGPPADFWSGGHLYSLLTVRYVDSDAEEMARISGIL